MHSCVFCITEQFNTVKMSNCIHQLFYRRISKNQKNASDRILWQAFKPRNGEDGIENGPSVYLSSLRCPLAALDGHCELFGMHLVAFRECSTDLHLTIEQRDPDDDSHYYILNFPHDEHERSIWAKHLCNVAHLKVRCVNKKIDEILDDPEVNCQKLLL